MKIPINRNSLMKLIAVIAIVVLCVFVLIAYFTRDSRREAQLRDAIQQEMANIQFDAPFESQPADSFHCGTGDGAFGSPQGFNCIGGITKKIALPQDKDNAEQYVASKMADAGWRSDGMTGTKTVGNIRLRVILSTSIRASTEGLGGSARAQAIQAEEINEINNILDQNPGTSSVTFLIFSASYVELKNNLVIF